MTFELDFTNTTVAFHLFCIFISLLRLCRQKDGKHFAELLNRLRVGQYTQEDINLLQQKADEFSGQADQCENAIHLYTTNLNVEKHNEAIFTRVLTEKLRWLSCIPMQ